MDIFNEPRVNKAIWRVDQQATTILNAYVNDFKYRNPTNPQKLTPGFGGSGGKMVIKMRYVYSSLNEIQRIINVRFEGDAGEVYNAGPITLFTSSM